MEKDLEFAKNYHLYEIKNGSEKTSGILCTINIFDHNISQHEAVNFDKVVSYMKDIKTNEQRTPVVFGLKNFGFQRVIFSIIRRSKRNAKLYSVRRENGMVHKIWTIDLKYKEVLSCLLKAAHFLVIDGHHRYNAIKLNALSGGCEAIKAWVVPTTECQISPVHRIVKVSAEGKNGIISTLKKRINNPCTSACLKFTSKKSVGMFDGKEWVLFPDFKGLLADNLIDLNAICHEYAASIEYLPAASDLVDRISEATKLGHLIFTFPSFDFENIFKFSEMGRLLPAFSTYILPKPLEGILRDSQMKSMPLHRFIS